MNKSLETRIAYQPLVSMLRIDPRPDGKVSLNSFVYPNSPTLIESRHTQLLVGLNGHQPN